MTREEALDAIWMRCRHNDKTYEAYCVLMRELGLNELGGGDRVKPELAKELNELNPYEDAISRQEAIDIIESWLSCDDYNEAERHIMRATESILHDLPPVNPAEDVTDTDVGEMPCEDAISRAEIVRKLNAWDHNVNAIPNYVWRVIREVPSVTPAEKQGPKYCDRNICMANEYNGIGCAECEVRIIGKPDRGRKRG